MTKAFPFTARRLLRAASQATLATQSEGQPFASLVTPAVAPDGSILLLLSALSVHTRHLMAEPRCALLAVGAPSGPNPQTTPRITVTGRACQEQDPAWRTYWLARHPYAAEYASFTDFSVWRLLPQAGHLVAGFARAHALSAADLAPPSNALSAVAEATRRIISHCNSNHREALSVLACQAGASGTWRMFGVDPDGFDLVQDGLAEYGSMPKTMVLRIAFDQPACTARDVHAALVRLVQSARAG